MPRLVDHDAYRSDLVQRCVSLFAKEGYQALTMRKIANALGVSTGTVYHYFPNKEALFLGVVNEVVRQDLTEAEAALPLELPSESLPTFLLQYVKAREAWFRQQHLVLCEYLRNKDPRAIRNDRNLRAAAKTYHENTGRLLRVNAEQAKTLLFFLKGLIIQRFFDGGRTSFESQELYLRALLESMKREAAA